MTKGILFMLTRYGDPHRSCAKHCIRYQGVREVTDVDVSIYDATYHNYVASTPYAVLAT